jgi:hypothetical protein
MAGVIGQGTAVEKLQEVQQQSPEMSRQQALAAAEVEKRRQQKQVTKSPEGEKSAPLRRREARKFARQRKKSDPGKGKEESSPKGKGGAKPSGRIIDIVI